MNLESRTLQIAMSVHRWESLHVDQNDPGLFSAAFLFLFNRLSLKKTQNAHFLKPKLRTVCSYHVKISSSSCTR